LIKKQWENNFHIKGNKPENKNNVFLATTDLVPRCKNAKVGLIVYDITPLILPQYFNIKRSGYYEEMKNRLKRTDFIIAISKTTKRDIAETFKYPNNKIIVIYPGAPYSGRKETQSFFGFKRPYICYLGALAKNKNVDGMLRIFARCVHEHKIDYNMVLTGKDFCGKTFWAQLLKDLKIEDRVHINGWVTEKERDAILSNATMLWHFSWYEGFGLPVLEAAAKGIPVLYTNRGAVPEILGNPEQEIDPDDEDDTVNRAVTALSSEDILSKWRKDSLLSAANFSWEASASQLLNWFEAVI
jgi:glycosyltransferase involved in cell wall biosynthesis